MKKIRWASLFRTHYSFSSTPPLAEAQKRHRLSLMGPIAHIHQFLRGEIPQTITFQLPGNSCLVIFFSFALIFVALHT